MSSITGSASCSTSATTARAGGITTTRTTERSAAVTTAGLAVTQLSHAYGAEPVLRDVSLALEAGRSAALMGPSGCGKTTLLLAAAGILVPSAGEIRVAGDPVPTGSADSRAAF